MERAYQWVRGMWWLKGYIAAPIAITVEGANILTRTLIIFGQGALRAHPFLYKEVAAVEAKDKSGFDQAFGDILDTLFVIPPALLF